MGLIRTLTATLFFLCASLQLKAQLGYTMSSSNSAMTYLSGGGTVAVSLNHAPTYADDAYSDPINIGFTFPYGCTTYTQFAVCTNGWMGLGNNINSETSWNNLAGTYSWPIIAPLWDDLEIGTGGAVTYKVTGAPGSKILTVEWKKMEWDYNAAGPVISFQVKLYEATGNIEYIYKNEGTAPNSGSASIGLNNLGVDYWSLNGSGASPTALYKTETNNLGTVPPDGTHYLWTATGNMAYSSSNVTQPNTTTVSKCGVDQDIVRLQVVVTGACSSLSLTQIQFNMNGSTIAGTNTNDVTKIHIYYTGLSSNLNKMTEFVSGGITVASGTITANGSVSLSQGTNYFWLSYDINSSAATVGNVLDAQITQITIGGANKTPTTTNPAGTRAIAACMVAPGGVKSNMGFWVKGNAGTSSTVNNTAISSWNDQSGNARHATQATAAFQPKYYDNATNNLNFNPVVDFDDASQDNTNGDYMDIVSNNILPAGNEAYSVYAVLLPGPNNNVLAPGKFLHSGTGPSTFCAFDIRYGMLNDSWDLNDLTVNSQWSPGVALMGSFNFDYAIRTMYTAGTQVGSLPGTSRNSTNTLSGLGAQMAVSPHSEFFDGSIAEIITYPNISHSQTERFKIESYLATKYGITLSHNYVSSKGVIVWDQNSNTSYDLSIIGIGRDDNSALSQKQSKSTSSTDIVTISIGPSLQANQLNNTGTIAFGDQSFFYSGSNGASPTFAANAEAPPNTTTRLGREWYVQKTNFTNTDVTLTFDLSGAGAVTPSNVRMLVDADGNFTNATVLSTSTAVMNFAGSTLTVVLNATNFTATPYYTLAQGATLPVNFINVEAALKLGTSNIRWTTATEKNNDYFVVERSTNGSQFEILGQVKARGNSTIATNYSYVDNHPYPGISYYRLKQVDVDGQFSYSKIVSVSQELINEVEVYPNPLTKENFSGLSILGLETGKEILVSVTDVHGNELFSKIIVTGMTERTLLGFDPYLNMPPGIYFIIATSDQNAYKLKLIITDK